MQCSSLQISIWCGVVQYYRQRGALYNVVWCIVQCGALYIVQCGAVLQCGVVHCTVWWPFGPRVTSRLPLSPPSCLTELSGSAISCGFLISPPPSSSFSFSSTPSSRSSFSFTFSSSYFSFSPSHFSFFSLMFKSQTRPPILILLLCISLFSISIFLSTSLSSLAPPLYFSIEAIPVQVIASSSTLLHPSQYIHRDPSLPLFLFFPLSKEPPGPSLPVTILWMQILHGRLSGHVPSLSISFPSVCQIFPILSTLSFASSYSVLLWILGTWCKSCILVIFSIRSSSSQFPVWFISPPPSLLFPTRAPLPIQLSQRELSLFSARIV